MFSILSQLLETDNLLSNLVFLDWVDSSLQIILVIFLGCEILSGLSPHNDLFTYNRNSCFRMYPLSHFRTYWLRYSERYQPITMSEFSISRGICWGGVSATVTPSLLRSDIVVIVAINSNVPGLYRGGSIKDCWNPQWYILQSWFGTSHLQFSLSSGHNFSRLTL